MKCLKCSEEINGTICEECGTEQESYIFENLDDLELEEILNYIFHSGQFELDIKILHSVFGDLLVNFPQQLYIYRNTLDEQLLSNIRDLKTYEESLRFLNIKTKYFNEIYGLSQEAIYNSVKHLIEAVNKIKIDDTSIHVKEIKKTSISKIGIRNIYKVIVGVIGVATLAFFLVLSAIEKKEVVGFLEDTEAPIITLNGEDTVKLIVGDEYQELGASVVDNNDTNLRVEITGIVDSNKPGTYIIYYNKEDTSGNKASSKIRVVTVVDEKVVDTEAPIITLNGEEKISLIIGEEYQELGAIVEDNLDKNLEVKITGSVDINTLGTYIIYYNVEDEAGNNASSMFRVVNVTEEKEEKTQGPIIILNEDNEKTVVVNYIYKNKDIIIEFPWQINVNTVSKGISVIGDNRGIYSYTPIMSGRGKTLTLDLNEDFYNGEVVRVYITEKLKDINNNSIGATSYEFRVKTEDLVGNLSPNIITDTADGAQAIYAADIDNDGDIDLLSANYNDNNISWYENNNQVFIKHIITDTAEGAMSVNASDLDNDGDLDVLSASYKDDTIAWYENNNQVFIKHIITDTAEGAVTVYSADIDNDGDMDVLCSSNKDYEISWYENTNNLFIKHKIVSENKVATQNFRIKSLYMADMDNDGDMDILRASVGASLMWYINDNQVFTQGPFANSSNADSVYAADMDNDGDMDLLTASDYNNSIAWYENRNLAFIEHAISNTGNESYKAIDYGANSVYAIDMDNDGDMDVVTAEYNRVSWYENNNLVFSKHVIADTANRITSVNAVDIDNDGDVDVVSASNYDNTITWYGETSYTLSILDYDDSELSKERLTHNSNVSTVPSPVREGYSLIGWSDGVKMYGIDLKEFTMPEINVTLVSIYD
ncbi:FG-GAP-like repeat-containing protein [Mycoplasmatota bacterium WC44]